jgi:uncharacterized protein (TIGR01244 family)
MNDPAHIANWQRIDPRITTSGQPSEAELAQIAGLGVRCVINLGLHSHARALPDEAASVAALGMRYAHIPVDFQSPTEADFTAFLRALTETANDPVHVHCIANYRVSAFFYRYRRDILGWNEPAARAEMERIWQPNGVWAEFVTP